MSMYSLSYCFDNSFSAKKAFVSEEVIRLNHEMFRGYCFKILNARELPLSSIAFTFYLRLVSQSDKELRKDKSTYREQHEESHMVTLDALLDVVGMDWIDEEEYGSIDVLFTACVLHDVIEDLKFHQIISIIIYVLV